MLITQIRFEGREIGFHLSAGPNPQLPMRTSATTYGSQGRATIMPSVTS